MIIPGSGEHDRIQLSRAVVIGQASRQPIRYSAPDDLIIKKLWFYQMGGSDKHLRDIASMLKVSGEQIDRAYVSRWAATLGLNDIWVEIIKQAP